MPDETQEMYVNIDMQEKEIRNVVIDAQEAKPSTGGKDGQAVTFEGELYISNGTTYEMLAKDKDVKAVGTRVGTLETIVSAPTTGLVDKVSALEAAIGAGSGSDSLTSKVTKLEEDVSDLDTRLTATTTTANAAKTASETNAANIATNTGDISSLKEAVGDSTKGLSKDVADLKTTVNDPATGLVKKVADNTSAIAANTTAIGTNASAIGALETTVTQHTADIAGKVDKVEGKQLSTEDYTTAEKTKLAGIIAGAQPNIIETVKVNGTALDVTDKGVNVDLTEYAKKSDVVSVYKPCGSIASVNDLPADSEPGDTYDIATAFTMDGKVYPAGTNVAWVEKPKGSGTYVWDPLGGQWDMENYLTKTQVNNALALKANAADVYTQAQVNTELGKKVDKLDTKPTAGTFTKVTINAEGQVTAGANLAASDVPALDAAKITTGTFVADRIPDLDAAKIKSGTLAAERLPSIPAANLPIVPAEKLALEVKTQAVTAGQASFSWTHGFGGEPYFVQVVKGGKVVIGLNITYTASMIVVEASESLPTGLTIKAIGPRA